MTTQKLRNSKYSCATLLAKINEKYLRCRSSRWQVFFKVSVLKKSLQPCSFITKILQRNGFFCEIWEIFKNTLFIELLRWQLLAMGVPYLVKLEVTFFIKKLNFIHQRFLSQFKKRRKKKSVIKTFRVCYFGQHIFPLISIEAWNWNNADVSEKQTDCSLLI